MKKIVLAFICIMLLLSAFQVTAAAPDSLYSESVCLMDYETGQVLFEKNMHKRAYPASTTKIMTAILAVENGFPEEIMTASGEAVDIDEPQSSNIGLVEDENLTLNDGLFAMMLPSANDAANVVGEHIGGTLKDFADMMTTKAHLLGAENTNFENAHGLHESNHYTTAYDLALITRYAAGDDRFLRYFGSDSYTMEPTNKMPQERTFSNYQYMLVKTSSFYDPEVIGGKVGYTDAARHTMSTVAEHDGRKLICVVMKSSNRNDKFVDTQKLLKYGFTSFRPIIAPKDSFTEFTVPIIDDSQQTGFALFDNLPDFPVLLENSLEESSITMEIVVPNQFAPGDRFTCDVIYQLTDPPPGIPKHLGTQTIIGSNDTLPTEVATFAPIVNPSESIPPKLVINWILVVGSMAGAVIVILLSTIILRHYTLLRRRKLRMRRMRLQLEQEQKRAEARKEFSMADKIRIRQYRGRL